MSNTIIQTLPHLSDKFIIELCNSIQVSKDHVFVQYKRLGKIPRFIDFFTGAGAKRQNQLNENLTVGLDSAFEWLNQLTNEVNLSFQAITTLNKTVTNLNNAVTLLGEYSIETRELLLQMETKVKIKMEQLDQRLLIVEAENRATRQIDILFGQWQSKEFQDFPSIMRLYIVLERLYWGGYGQFIKKYENHQIASDLRMLVKSKIISQLQEDSGLDINEYGYPTQWNYSDKKIDVEFLEYLNYSGDWSSVDRTPLNFYASQRPTKLNFNIPRLITPQSLARQSMYEIFEIRK